MEKIINRPRLTISQNRMVEILWLLKKLAPYRQPDPTDMPELESEEYAAQKRNQD